eukprot:gene27137-29926_t
MFGKNAFGFDNADAIQCTRPGLAVAECHGTAMLVASGFATDSPRLRIAVAPVLIRFGANGRLLRRMGTADRDASGSQRPNSAAAGPLLTGQVLPFTGVRYHRPADFEPTELAPRDAQENIRDGGEREMLIVRSGAIRRSGRVRPLGGGQVLVIALALAACARPTGDFDRAVPSPAVDSWMPAAGNVIANIGRGEAVSDFNQTDEEKTLRDRAWTLVQPPHLNDWFGTTLVEAQRARILPELDSRFSEKAYYELLRRDPFASSETRWQRLVTDMRTDTLLIGPFWKQVRTVKADDIARTHTMD